MLVGRIGGALALRGFTIAGAVCALILSSSSAWAQYDFVPLPVPAGSSAVALNINNSGAVVGYHRNTGFPFHGFLSQGGVTTDLGTLGGTQSYSSQITDTGTIIGSASIAGNAELHVVTWSGFTLTDHGTLSGYKHCLSTSGNKHGEIVGEASLRGFGNLSLPISQAYYHKDGGFTALPTLGGRISRANCVNDHDDHGDVVGVAEMPDSPLHRAVLWTQRQGVWSVANLGVLAGFDNSAANGINNSNKVVGWSYNSTMSLAQAFYYDGTSMSALPGLGGSLTSAVGINKFGVIVGWSETINGVKNAVMWDKGQLINLNTYLPANSGYVLMTAVSINDGGDIAGTAIDSNAMMRPFILKKKTGK
jgi:probable HAF family extracellular repeat protein